MDNSFIKLSIGLPVYNGEDYLAIAIDSILKQTEIHFELIISDNGSSDETHEICKKYAVQDPRIRYYREDENKGAGWNFDRVLELANGEYFRWACHDDVLAPSLLERCLEVMTSNSDIVLCYPRSLIIDEIGTVVREGKARDDGMNFNFDKPEMRWREYLDAICDGHNCCPLYGIIRTDVLRQLRPFGSYPSSDMVLLGQLTLYGPFYEVSERLFLKRDHADTSVRKHNAFRDRIAWYNPNMRGKLHLTRWKWLLEYVRGISVAPLTLSSRILCYFILSIWIKRDFFYLLKDVAKLIAWPGIKFVWFLQRKVTSPTIAQNLNSDTS